jgi:hypothetical protein
VQVKGGFWGRSDVLHPPCIPSSEVRCGGLAGPEFAGGQSSRVSDRHPLPPPSARILGCELAVDPADHAGAVSGFGPGFALAFAVGQRYADRPTAKVQRPYTSIPACSNV